MICHRATDEEGNILTFPPEGRWLWVWGPDFPMVLKGYVHISGSDAFWVGEHGRYGAHLITHWREGKIDKNHQLVGEAPAKPDVA